MRTTLSTHRKFAWAMAIWMFLSLLLALMPIARAAAAGDAVVALTASAQAGSATWITISSPFSGDANANSYTTYDYGASSSGPWTPCNSLFAVAGESAIRGCIVNSLSANTDYWARVTFVDADGVNGPNPQIIGPIHTPATAVAATTLGTVAATVEDTSILVSATITGDSNKNSNLASVDLGSSAGGPWTPNCATSIPDFGPKFCSLHGLTHDTDYWVRVTLADTDGVSGTNPVILGPIRYTGMTDLAFGKPISADAGWGCCGDPSQLVDGRTQHSSYAHGFAWTGGTGGWGGGSAGMKQATIDLGSPQTVTRLDAWLHQNNAVPLSWKVLLSTDGAQFSEVFSTNQPTCRTINQRGFNVDWGQSSCSHSARFAPTQARYVRYMFDDTTMFDNMHGWAVELEVFGPPIAQWAQLAPSGTPPAVHLQSSTAYDAAHDRLILFSGNPNSAPHATDTWVLANAAGAPGTADWTQLAPSGGPPQGRGLSSAVYDPNSNRLIVFGGCAFFCSPALGDLWALTNANGLGGPPAWIQLPAAPFTRVGQLAGYDPANNRMIVFGGHLAFPGTDKNDVWVATNANGISTPTWAQLAPTGTPPPARGIVSGDYDPASNRLFIFGGETAGSTTVPTNYFNDVWVLSNANGLGGTPTWSQLSPIGLTPAARGYASVHYDPTSNRLIVFGGADETTTYNDTWVLTNADGAGATPQWLQIGATDGPPLARLAQASAYSVAANRLLITMGRNDHASPTSFNDVWALANANGLITVPQHYSISGAVRDIGNAPVAGVTISDGKGHSAITNASGNYTITDLPAGDYTLSASKAGYTMEPPTRSVSVPPDATGQDFTATPIPPVRYMISGTIRDAANNPLSGVVLSDGNGHSATTSITGTYTFKDLLAGSYTLTPTKSNYTFNPSSRTVTVAPSATGQDFIGTGGMKPWTFMLYLDGDNNLTRWIERAIRALEAQPGNQNINIIALIDGSGSNDTRRLLIQPGGVYTLNVNKWDLGERDMGDPQTLTDFISWSHDHFPAQHYYLSIADHGRGTSGVAWDDTNGGDNLTPSELRAALSAATNAGTWKIDVLHYDTCLMAMFEHAYDIRSYADYLVASENLGWSVFAYDRYTATTNTGAMSAPSEIAAVTAQVAANTTPRQLATSLVDTYFNHPLLQSAPRTISALDLSKVDATRKAIDKLASAMSANLGTVKNNVGNVRAATQKFDSRDYYRITTEDEYVDLYDLAARLKAGVPNSAIQAAAQGVLDAISGGLVVAEHHQSGFWTGGVGETYWDLSGAHGVSIYFPPRSGSLDYNRYTSDQIFSFTIDSTWDDFLEDYFSVIGLPPDPEEDPGIPPLLTRMFRVYLPMILR